MLYLNKKIGNSTLAIWKVEESAEELLSMLRREEWLQEVFAVSSIPRKREMLATRVLLKEVLGKEKYIRYLKTGRPYLDDHSYQISISHTKDFVAIVLNKKSIMGLDIEQRTDKIFKVRDRIITKYDFIDPTNEQVHLLLHWSAKEAMFKYLDATGVDIRRHLHIEPFTPQESGVFDVSESRTSARQLFKAHYVVHKDFVLVCLDKA